MNSQPISDEALRKRKRGAIETADERESQLSKDRERKRKKVEEETEEQRVKWLEYQPELSSVDRKLLKNFCKKMDKLRHVLCPVCNKSCPSIVLVNGKCRRCYSEKIMPNKFSAENNMDPGEVPEEL
ncbi:unnamed protein product [Rhizophagus irregularis]|nr:unnamed protein product [Rhizophagus irregularis]